MSAKLFSKGTIRNDGLNVVKNPYSVFAPIAINSSDKSYQVIVNVRLNNASPATVYFAVLDDHISSQGIDPSYVSYDDQIKSITVTSEAETSFILPPNTTILMFTQSQAGYWSVYGVEV